MTTTLREALKSRKIAQDAKKPFGTFEDHMTLASQHESIQKVRRAHPGFVLQSGIRAKSGPAAEHAKLAKEHTKLAEAAGEFKRLGPFASMTPGSHTAAAGLHSLAAKRYTAAAMGSGDHDHARRSAEHIGQSAHYASLMAHKLNK